MSALEEHISMRGLLAPGRRQAYALAGKAIITVRSISTGARFTFKITKYDVSSLGKYIHFVKLLTGPDNSSNYQYLGTIFSEGFRLTAKSRAGLDAPSVRAFSWLTRNWEDPRAEVWHEGVCGRCGRRLTVPESIESGIGPTCKEKA